MKVELTIADDRELRNAIRDLIKSEVVSIARGEIRDIIKDVANDRSTPLSEKDLDGMVKGEVNAIIRKELHIGAYQGDQLKDIVRSEVEKILRELWERGRISV